MQNVLLHGMRMIQVVERIGKIIDTLAGGCGGVPLKEIEQKTGLNKATLCNLLKSLCDIGYVCKQESGVYAVGERLREIAYPHFVRDNLYTVARQCANDLSRLTCESGVVAIRDGGNLLVIAKAVYEQSLVLNSKLFDSLHNNFNTASGHIFMAFDKELDLQKLYSESLPTRYKSLEELNTELNKIRKDGYCIMHINEREAIALAVPVIHENKIFAAMAIVAPLVRCDSTRENELISYLKTCSRNMSTLLV